MVTSHGVPDEVAAVVLKMPSESLGALGAPLQAPMAKLKVAGTVALTSISSSAITAVA